MRRPIPAARWILRFGYDGADFAGWARQPGLRTIESEIRKGALRCGLVASEDALELEVASRTDRGVHARRNVLVLSSSVPGPALLGALNGISPEIWFDRAARAPPGFRVRGARQRWYRYFEPASGARLDVWREAARCFRGPVDVRSFARGVPMGTPTIRIVDRVTVRRSGPWLWIDVRAPSFVWGMVRKMVSSMREMAQGRLTADALRAAVAGDSLLSLPLAEPDRLVLWEVVHGIRWTEAVRRPGRRQFEHRNAARVRAATRAQILESTDPWSGALPGRSAGPAQAARPVRA